MKPCAFEIGGRYQNVHESTNACEGFAVGTPDWLFSEIAVMLAPLPALLDGSFVPDLTTADAMAVSKGLAEVFGVLADPNEANAPEPRPKALEAPLVGDTRPPGVVLKGFGLVDEGVSPPWRLGNEALRLKESPLDPCPGVERESLPVFVRRDQRLLVSIKTEWDRSVDKSIEGGEDLVRMPWIDQEEDRRNRVQRRYAYRLRLVVSVSI